MILETPLSVFLVVNKDGQFFRAKGYRGYGDSWVNDVKKARIYTRIGPARSCVTFYSKWKDEHGIPDIVQFDLVSGTILNETDRVLKAVKKIETDKINRELSHKEWQKKNLEEQIENAKKQLRNLS